MSSIEIPGGVIDMMVPELKDASTLEGAHGVVKAANPGLHFIHSAVVGGIDAATNYDRGVIDAIAVGAKSYEALNLATEEDIPPDFIMGIIGNHGQDPNLGLALAKNIAKAREELFDTRHKLALGIQAICAAHTDQELAAVYSVGGAALARSFHEQVYQLWQLEKDFNS